jgi:hypothetical protein
MINKKIFLYFVFVSLSTQIMGAANFAQQAARFLISPSIIAGGFTSYTLGKLIDRDIEKFIDKCIEEQKVKKEKIVGYKIKAQRRENGEKRITHLAEEIIGRSPDFIVEVREDNAMGVVSKNNRYGFAVGRNWLEQKGFEAENPDYMRYLLAHECAHIQHNDMEQRKRMVQILPLAGASIWKSVRIVGYRTLFALPLTVGSLIAFKLGPVNSLLKQQEKKADLAGAESDSSLIDSGIRLFKHYDENYNYHEKSWFQKLTTWSLHPTHQERIAYLEEKKKQLLSKEV